MRSLSVAYVFFISVIASNGAAFAQTTKLAGARAAGALPQIPAPTGSFGIGRIGYDWVDPSRSDRYSSKPNAHRELMVYFWYPTATKYL